VTLTRQKFEEMIRPLVQRSIVLIDELLERTAYPIETIDNILLVGDSSCIPLVRTMLSERYGKDKILSSEKPMFAIAEGAAILSYTLFKDSAYFNNRLIKKNTRCIIRSIATQYFSPNSLLTTRN
jgi:molecular chaperone DnaK (HSP70)